MPQQERKALGYAKVGPRRNNSWPHLSFAFRVRGMDSAGQQFWQKRNQPVAS